MVSINEILENFSSAKSLSIQMSLRDKKLVHLRIVVDDFQIEKQDRELNPYNLYYNKKIYKLSNLQECQAKIQEVRNTDLDLLEKALSKLELVRDINQLLEVFPGSKAQYLDTKSSIYEDNIIELRSVSLKLTEDYTMYIDASEKIPFIDTIKLIVSRTLNSLKG